MPDSELQGRKIEFYYPKTINKNTFFFRYFSDTFACPDLGIKFLYQFFALSPNLRSKVQKSELQRRKNEIK